MRKRTLYIGLGLMLAAIIIFFLLGFAAEGLIGAKSTVNITTTSYGYNYLRLRGNSTGSLAIYALLSSRANVYLVNQSVFTGFEQYVSANSMNSGYSYMSGESLNATRIFRNVTNAITYLLASKQNASSYSYLVIDNTRGSDSAGAGVEASVIYFHYNPSTGIVYSIAIVADGIAFIIGIALVILGLIKKEKSEIESPEKAKEQQQYVDALYKNVGKKDKRKNIKRKKAEKEKE